ncbi:MAG TPA: carbohydrate binding domain-containing protein [Longimicrobium sp.]|jgi:hypothetical protein
MRRSALSLVALAAFAAACQDAASVTGPDLAGGPVQPPPGPVFVGSVASPAPRFYAAGQYALGNAPRRTLTLVDPTNPRGGWSGDPRITDAKAANYTGFWSSSGVPALIASLAQDSRLNLNPSYVLAIIAKESGMDSLSVSGYPANGYTQITHGADQGLLDRTTWMPEIGWMRSYLLSLPRDPRVHSYSATEANTESLLASGEINSRNSYFFNPRDNTQVGVYDLRQLETTWRTHETWTDGSGVVHEGYATRARQVLNGGNPVTEAQMLELVTVSYNAGMTFVFDRLGAYGAGWVQSLEGYPPGTREYEASDYLERVKHYTVIFQDVAADASRSRQVLEDLNSGVASWSAYSGGGSTVTIAASSLGADDGGSLRADYTMVSGGYGGVGRFYSTARNWRTAGFGTTGGVSFWYYGNGKYLSSGSGVDVKVELQDNRNPGFTGDTAERWTCYFRDDFTGWRYVHIPWSEFRRSTWQPANAPTDGVLGLTEVWGIAISPQTGSGWFKLDRLALTS